MKTNSLKFIFLLISVFILVSLACGVLSRTDPTATALPRERVEDPPLVETVEEPIVVVVEPELPVPTETPMQEIPPTMTHEPVEEITEVPIEEVYQEPPAFFTEEFDGDLSSWSYFLMSGDENKMNYLPIAAGWSLTFKVSIYGFM